MTMSDPDVNITSREKIYPEEDFEYEGTVNGKDWSAKQTLGVGATITLTAPDDVDLTDDEKQAIYDAIRGS